MGPKERKTITMESVITGDAEFFDDVGEIIEIVEKDFTLKPTMESYPLRSHSSD